MNEDHWQRVETIASRYIQGLVAKEGHPTMKINEMVDRAVEVALRLILRVDDIKKDAEKNVHE